MHQAVSPRPCLYPTKRQPFSARRDRERGQFVRPSKTENPTLQREVNQITCRGHMWTGIQLERAVSCTLKWACSVPLRLYSGYRFTGPIKQTSKMFPCLFRRDLDKHPLDCCDACFWLHRANKPCLEPHSCMRALVHICSYLTFSEAASPCFFFFFSCCHVISHPFFYIGFPASPRWR